MNDEEVSGGNRGSVELRFHATHGLYVCVPVRHVEDLQVWLTFRGVLSRCMDDDAGFHCEEGLCVLTFPGVSPAWVRDELVLFSYDVKVGEGVLFPEYDYPPAVAQLLRLGNPDKTFVDCEALGLTHEHVPALTHMAADEELNNLDASDRRCWGPVHAWRALGQMRAAEAAPTLVDLLWRVDACDDERLAVEVPEALVEIGEPALAPLAAYFDEDPDDVTALEIVAETIGKIGVQYPQCRARCVRELTERLLAFDLYDPSANGSVVCSLVDLHAVESLAVVEAAYAAGAVDELWVGDIEDVRIAFGVQAYRLTSRARHFDAAEDETDAGDVAQPGRKVSSAASSALDVEDEEDFFDDEDLLEPYVAPLKVGRNDFCPCGSGKKYKKCCGRAGAGNREESIGNGEELVVEGR